MPNFFGIIDNRPNKSNRFISVAEETGLINGIGEWSLMTACRTVVIWNRDREMVFGVAVNLSARQFHKMIL